MTALLLKAEDGLPDFADTVDQVHVISHDLQVISLVDLAFNLEALLERLDRVDQEFSLVVILLFNVRVDVSVFGLLVFDELEQRLLHSYL